MNGPNRSSSGTGISGKRSTIAWTDGAGRGRLGTPGRSPCLCPDPRRTPCPYRKPWQRKPTGQSVGKDRHHHGRREDGLPDDGSPTEFERGQVSDRTRFARALAHLNETGGDVLRYRVGKLSRIRATENRPPDLTWGRVIPSETPATGTGVARRTGRNLAYKPSATSSNGTMRLNKVETRLHRRSVTKEKQMNRKTKGPHQTNDPRQRVIGC